MWSARWPSAYDELGALPAGANAAGGIRSNQGLYLANSNVPGHAVGRKGDRFDATSPLDETGAPFLDEDRALGGVLSRCRRIQACAA